MRHLLHPSAQLHWRGPRHPDAHHRLPALIDSALFFSSVFCAGGCWVSLALDFFLHVFCINDMHVVFSQAIIQNAKYLRVFAYGTVGKVQIKKVYILHKDSSHIWEMGKAEGNAIGTI